ncbi:hypothetical protein ACQ902_000009 [Vibrio mimicus]|uniref:DUF7220 family protein n=1 Tax=Vibrio mimicus TaxID=674 RepID=UPI0011D49940|nr:hypothetical protein [Vibrio mimicus]TXY45039.1 hypothetical protein FXE78_17215 [Vibrio mimicus]
MQRKKQSLLESLCNVLVGYIVALISLLIIFPMFDVNLKLEENMMISAYFTLISIGRSYSLRRLFNRKQNRNPIMDRSDK